jgi:predicted lipoprotein with Yx(FWY)xxD motif
MRDSIRTDVTTTGTDVTSRHVTSTGATNTEATSTDATSTGTGDRSAGTGFRWASAVAVAAALLVLGACGGGGDGGGSGGGTPSEHGESSTKAKTLTARSTDLGKVLAGGQDKTLYLFEKDKSPKSTCSGGCAQAWPPMVVKGKPVAGSGGVKKGLLGTSKRKDGKTQVTYKGRPLYYFQGDQKSSQTNGQGLDQFGAKWYALAPDGKAVKKKGKGGGGGGGY